MDKELQERIISSIPRDIPKSLVIVLWDFVLLGLIAFLFGVFKLDPLRAWQTFLINFLFWSGISLSGIVFAATFQVTDARWGRSVKRLMEGMGFFLPVSFVLFLILFLGRDVIFPWIAHPAVGKEKWLSIPFLFSRDAVGLILLYGLSLAFLYFSLKPDLALARGGAGNSLEAKRVKSQKVLSVISPVLLIVYAVIFTLIAFDLVMSLDPHWYSSLFGGYFFIGNLYVGLASITIIAVIIRKYYELEDVITIDVLHNLGKLTLAFCLLSMDFFWSQFLVIWYGNLPEETSFIIKRGMEAPWAKISWSVLIICFIWPFLVMLSRKVKRNPKTLSALCGVIIAGMWMERYLLIVPSLWKGDTAPFGILEILITLGFFAGFVLTYLCFVKRFPLLPVTDPLLKKED
jgi:hypothetical protein